MSIRKKLEKYIRVYKIFFTAYWKSRLIYKTDFFLGVTSQSINLVFNLAFLTLIFTQVESLQGWTFHEMLLLAGFSGLILNLHHIFGFGLYSLGETYIIEGRLDRYLVRPLNPLFQVYANYISDDNVSKLLVNIGVISYAVFHIETTILTLTNLLYAVLAMASGVMILASIFLAFSSTAFWTARSKAVFWLFFEVSNFRKYPYSIFSTPIQLFLISIIPIAFASFFPVTFFLGRDEWFIWQMLSLIIGPFFYLISYGIWKIGIRNYSSTGS